MLKEKAGIAQIQKLYLQLLFKCNFNCIHCFQGEKLQKDDLLSSDEAKRVITLFANDYGLKNVTLLGGEPFIHPDLPEVLSFCKKHSLETAVCTNGYRIGKVLSKIAQNLDHLRVSIDGIENTHDAMRRPGSFKAALETLKLAQDLGIYASVTMTVTSQNFSEVYALSEIVKPYGVELIKLHQLRLVGNAENRTDLLCTKEELGKLAEYARRVRQEIGIMILLDEDLDVDGTLISSSTNPERTELERIEIQPDGAIYVSCKAVGSDSNAFWIKKVDGQIIYQPTDSDEITVQVPQVRYSHI